MKLISLEQNEQEITVKGADCTSESKCTLNIENAAGIQLYKLVFNNDGSLYSFYVNGNLTSQRLKMTGIESTQSSCCAIHVSGHYCPSCKKIID